VQTTDDVLRLLDELGLEDMGVVLDTGHTYLAGEELPHVVKRLGKLLYHVHIADNHGVRDEHLIPGYGTIDFASFVTALREAGYKGYLVAELAFDYILDPDSSIRKALERMKGFMEC
jgi:protein FrlC